MSCWRSGLPTLAVKERLDPVAGSTTSWTVSSVVTGIVGESLDSLVGGSCDGVGGVVGGSGSQAAGRMEGPLATQELSLRAPLLAWKSVLLERLAVPSRKRNLRKDGLTCRPVDLLREVWLQDSVAGAVTVGSAGVVAGSGSADGSLAVSLGSSEGTVEGVGSSGGSVDVPAAGSVAGGLVTDSVAGTVTVGSAEVVGGSGSADGSLAVSLGSSEGTVEGAESAEGWVDVPAAGSVAGGLVTDSVAGTVTVGSAGVVGDSDSADGSLAVSLGSPEGIVEGAGSVDGSVDVSAGRIPACRRGLVTDSVAGTVTVGSAGVVGGSGSADGSLEVSLGSPEGIVEGAGSVDGSSTGAALGVVVSAETRRRTFRYAISGFVATAL